VDAKAKQQAKEYANGKRRAREKDFKIGDKVLLRQPHTNKYSTQFCSVPFTIIKINGSQLELQDQHGQKYKRNSAHMKKYHEPTERKDEEDDTETPCERTGPTTSPSTRRRNPTTTRTSNPTTPSFSTTPICPLTTQEKISKKNKTT
jgi:hypothetical protein